MRYACKEKICNYVFHLVEEDGKMIWISLKEYDGDVIFYTSDLLKECKRQIEAYFNGALKSFDLPYKIKGSTFALAVYKALSKVPYGRVITYKDLAISANYPNAYRAVGTVLNKNPLLLILPCHRIVSKKDIGGFAYGLKMKEDLLKIENIL